MSAKRELGFSIGTLVVLNLALAFSAIGLVSRMSPSLDRIVTNNVPSLEAADDMLEVLALSKDPLPPEALNQLEEAFTRAQLKVTEADEPAVLARLQQALDAARGGDSSVRPFLVQTVGELGEINRSVIARAELNARRLGLAGGWAAAFLGALSLWSSLVVMRRLRRHLLLPLDELSEVLRAHESGDSFRRASPHDAAEEWRYVATEVNRLLDDQQGRARDEAPSSRRAPAAAKSD